MHAPFLRILAAALALSALTGTPRDLRAQQAGAIPPPPPPIPPPPPPVQQQQPPAAYPAPQGYAYPPTYYTPAPQAPIRTGPEKPQQISPWDPEEPPPEGYRLRSSVSGGAIAGGVTLLSIFWVSSIVAGAIAAKDEKDRGIDGDGVEEGDWTPMYVPIVGPFAAISSVDASGAGAGALVIDGVLQTVGAGLIVLGILNKKYKVVRTQVGGAEVQVAPALSLAGPGMAVRGAF